MIITLLDLIDPSVFKRFDVVVINAAVDAIKQLKLDDQFNLAFFTIARAPHDLNTATFLAHTYESSDTGGTYVGNVRFSINERPAVFEMRAGCPLKRRNAIREGQAAVAIRARKFVKRSF